MKITLITGLDGSGKSTLLSRLALQPALHTPAILYLPQIETDSLVQDILLCKTAHFVNALGKAADEQQIPALKGTALCAAMLLFGPLLAHTETQSFSSIFCERHPLIDSGVYARFYAEKLSPESLPPKILDSLDQQYRGELEYLLSLLPDEAIQPMTGQMATLMNTMYHWFFLEKKTSISALSSLFKVDLPDKIYYLRADTNVLFERIRHREHREAHESVTVLEKLGDAYDQLFDGLNLQKPGLVEIVNANQAANLDRLFEQLSAL